MENSHNAQVQARQAAAAAAAAARAAAMAAQLVGEAVKGALNAAAQAQAAVEAAAAAGLTAKQAAHTAMAAEAVARQAAASAAEAAARAEAAVQQLELSQGESLSEHCLRTCSKALYPHLSTESRRVLRLACRAARDGVDASVQRLEFRGDGRWNAAALSALRWSSAKQLVGSHLHALPKLPPKLEELKLEDCRLDIAQAKALGCAAPSLTSLHFCVLMWVRELVAEPDASHTHKGNAKALALALTQLTSLRQLHLRFDIAHDCPAILAPAWGRLTGLTELELSKSLLPWPPQERRALVDALAGLTRLEVLRLTVEMGRADAEPFAAALGRLQRLRLLDLGSNTLSFGPVQPGAQAPDPADSGIHVLAPAIASLTRLQELRLNYSPLGPSVAALPSELPNLQVLDVSGCHLRSCGAEASAFIRSLPSLTELDISVNLLDSEDVTALAPALRVLSQLRRLDISTTYLQGEGASSMSVLTALRELRWLSLSAGGGGAPVVDVVRQLPWLEVLIFDHSKGPLWAGAPRSLTEMLRCLPNLHRLVLQSIAFNDKSGQHVGQALTHMTRLESLLLSFRMMGVEGAVRMLPHLQSLVSLESLQVHMRKGVLSADKHRLVAPLCQLSCLTRLRDLLVGDPRFGDDVTDEVERDRQLILSALPSLNADRFRF